MQLKPIDAKALSQIYEAHMVFDFPRAELKPLNELLKCMAEGSCQPYGLYDGDELTAYAVMLFAEPGAAGILDYLAAVRTHRDRGAGSEMLKKLQAELTGCAGILIEYEFPEDAADEAERSIRDRRERFYLRNGVRRTAIDLILFGVHFCVGYLPCERELPDATLKQMQKAVYDRVHCWDYHFQDNL